MYDFEIYTGKGTIADEYGIGMGGATVLRLCETLPKQLNYKCFTDNWFTSTGPHLIKIYNENMGGVDLSEMIAALYSLKIRCRRWYLRLWYFGIEVALSNAWFLYKRYKAQKNDKDVLSSLEFCLAVADALIHAGKIADLQTKKRGRPSLEDCENIPEPVPQRARY